MPVDHWMFGNPVRLTPEQKRRIALEEKFRATQKKLKTNNKKRNR